MSDVDAAPSSAPSREIQYDAVGRVIARGVDESRARAKARAARDRPKPLKLVVEIDGARGLPRDVHRVHATVRRDASWNLARSHRAVASSSRRRSFVSLTERARRASLAGERRAEREGERELARIRDVVRRGAGAVRDGATATKESRRRSGCAA
jgi:hypothetical protein